MRGAYRGPLHGIPYGLKDNFAVRGARMTANSRLMLKHVADSDATAHRRLQDAGAILLGKLSTYEYGTGDGDDLFELPFRPARNPWDPRRFPGGSTLGGGAAIAAGTAMLALGTDTTGSVRLPAAACGVAGLKPTYGLVSRAGVLPNCYSLDCVGPIAWTAQGTRLALRCHCGVRSARSRERRCRCGAGDAGRRIGQRTARRGAAPLPRARCQRGPRACRRLRPRRRGVPRSRSDDRRMRSRREPAGIPQLLAHHQHSGMLHDP